jgi:nicotinic acid mononucleotide adenylyltransferase
MKKVVTTFGRMNPPTSGHQKLVDKITSLAKGADARIYLSHSQNNKKDPLDYNTKIALAQKAFGSSVIKSNAKTIIQVMQELQKAGYTDVTIVVGSDRVKDFDTLLNKYNSKDYTFDSIKVVSAGQRDPDADDVSGMSASKLRALAKEGNFAGFKTGLPRNLQSNAKKIYDQLRSIMEQPEIEQQLDEYAVLNQQQRMKRARMMKRIAKKVARMRKIRAKRMADTNRLMKRSRKKAIQFLRKRVAGDRGQEYKTLGRAEKITIDKLVQKRSGMIDRLAKRLLPKVRKAEVARVAAARSTKTEEYLREETMPKTYKSLIGDAYLGPNEKRTRNEIDKDKWRNAKKYDRMRDVARMQDVMMHNRGITKEAYESLEKKAEAINVGIDTILEVYDNATINLSKNTTEEQQRFAAVNHFVAEARKNGLEGACWKGYEAIGTKKKNGKTVPNCVPSNEGVEQIDEIVPAIATAARVIATAGKAIKNGAKAIGKGTASRGSVGTMALEPKDTATSDVPKLSEISATTLIKYASKAASSSAAAKKAGDMATVAKREKGIARAMDKEVASRTQSKPVAEDAQKKNLKSILSKKKEAKSTAGAGEWGTDELVNKYVADTPHMTVQKWSAGYVQPANEETLHENPFLTSLATKAAKLMKKTDGDDLLMKQKARAEKAAQAARPEVQKAAQDAERRSQAYKASEADRAERAAQNRAKRGLKGVQDKLDAKNRKDFNFDKDPQGAIDKVTDLSKNPKVDPEVRPMYKDMAKKMAHDHAVKSSEAGQRMDAVKSVAKPEHKGTTAALSSSPQSQMGVTRKKFREILNNPQHPRHGEATKLKTEETINGYCPDTGELIESLVIEEAEHEGKKVKLNNPFRLPSGSKKKFGVYVKNDKGNVVKVTFGDPNMEIKRDDPERRKAFRSRHSCDDDIGPKWKARYWSCYQWRAGKKVDN